MSGADAGSSRGLRILLVGRNRIERALRRVEGVELLRARTATDAIGDAARARAEDEPVSAVLVDEGAVEEAERDDWRAAVRGFAPEATFQTLDASSNAQDVLARLRARPTEDNNAPAASDAERADQPSSAPRPAPAPTPTACEAPAKSARTPADWAGAVDAVLAGESPIAALVEATRRALGDATICFTRAGEGDGGDVRAGAAPVERHGVVYGSLCGARSDAEALAPFASEFASLLALAQQHQQLRRAAFTDHLTGAQNRRWFDYAFVRALERARVERRDVTLMVYDIDDFKSYNDRFGHAAGDEILRETVRLMVSVIRPADRVCRMGGDEFAVIFDDPSGPREGAGHHPTGIAAIAARFQRQICTHRFPKLAEEAPGTLTISGGMATFPWDEASAEALLERADALALQSKRQGKNLITFGPGAQRVCGETHE